MSLPFLYIGNKDYSSWSLRPWLVAKHAEIEFKESTIELGLDNTAEQIKAISPNQRVPCWHDDQLNIWDSLAICEYLAELKPNLWPQNHIARAEARSVSAEMHSAFVDLRNSLPMNVHANRRKIVLDDGTQADLKRIDQIWRSCREKYGSLGPWLFGHFSIADAMYAPVVLRLAGYDIPLSKTMQQYSQTWLDDQYLKEWIESAHADPKRLDRYEKIGKVTQPENPYHFTLE